MDRGRRSTELTHGLFGSTPDVVESLEQRLREQFPGLQIVAMMAPASGQEDNPPTIKEIGSWGADVIWCALGAPKQELWMWRNAAELSPALLLGVGAAFDFHAGTKARAPRLLQRTGLEWAHRLATEPRRLFMRYATTNAEFVVLALTEVTRARFSGLRRRLLA